MLLLLIRIKNLFFNIATLNKLNLALNKLKSN